MAANTFGNFETTLTRGMLAHEIEECMSSTSLFEPYYLTNPVVAEEAALAHFRSAFPAAIKVHASSTMVLEIGTVHRKQILMCRVQASLQVCKALNFFAVSSAEGVQFFVHAQPYTEIAAGKWSNQGAATMLYPCECMVAIILYASLDAHQIRISEPARVRVEKL